MTKLELFNLEKRIDEISNLLELYLDEDIHDNLILELEDIEFKLTVSLNETIKQEKLTKRQELGLRLIK